MIASALALRVRALSIPAQDQHVSTPVGFLMELTMLRQDRQSPQESTTPKAKAAPRYLQLYLRRRVNSPGATIRWRWSPVYRIWHITSVRCCSRLQSRLSVTTVADLERSRVRWHCVPRKQRNLDHTASWRRRKWSHRTRPIRGVQAVECTRLMVQLTEAASR